MMLPAAVEADFLWEVGRDIGASTIAVGEVIVVVDVGAVGEVLRGEDVGIRRVSSYVGLGVGVGKRCKDCVRRDWVCDCDCCWGSKGLFELVGLME